MTNVAPLRTGQSGVGLATLSGYLYYIGGKTGDTIVDLVDKYDPVGNMCKGTCAPL